MRVRNAQAPYFLCLTFKFLLHILYRSCKHNMTAEYLLFCCFFFQIETGSITEATQWETKCDLICHWFWVVLVKPELFYWSRCNDGLWTNIRTCKERTFTLTVSSPSCITSPSNYNQIYQIAIVVYHFTIAAYSIFSSFITLNVIKIGETWLLCDLVSLTLQGNESIPFWTNSSA